MLSQLVETSCSSQHNGCKTRLLDQLSFYRTSVQLEGGKEKDWREEEVEGRKRGDRKRKRGRGKGKRGRGKGREGEGRRRGGRTKINEGIIVTSIQSVVPSAKCPCDDVMRTSTLARTFLSMM